MRNIILITLAMFAFAANSVLCRQALGDNLIDPASFTAVRIISGAMALGLIGMFQQKQPNTASKINGWMTAAMLFIYMVFFSFAYVSLGAGTGALILFGAVQLTMFGIALYRGEYFSILSWAGLLLAISGLVYLISPGLTAPEPVGAILMAIAGVSWGLYSLAGRGVTNPLALTSRNFLFSIPPTLLVSLYFLNDFNISSYGLMLAIASGAAASGCGYVIWYAVLPKLSATRAATIQLSVPAIAALGGVVVLSEDLNMRLVMASLATLGGVALVLMQRNKKTAPQ